LSLLKRHPDKDSIAVKRYSAAWVKSLDGPCYAAFPALFGRGAG
jgi:hypothetical protein